MFVFGLVPFTDGIFLLRRGRLSKLIFPVMLALIALMFYLGSTDHKFKLETA